jgi:glycosyltransferase involved in cell wall biosynthesis
MPPTDVPEFLRFMDAMLVPSRDEGVMRETFSQAIVQGMLTGLPVCASNLPVLTEKLDAGGGLIFDSASQLAEHMQTLVADPALCRRLGEEGRRTALARYVWSTAAFVDRFLTATR